MPGYGCSPVVGCARVRECPLSVVQTCARPSESSCSTHSTHERQAALLFPDGQRTPQSLARLLDPASTLEHHGEVLVAPALEPDVVCLRLPR